MKTAGIAVTVSWRRGWLSDSSAPSVPRARKDRLAVPSHATHSHAPHSHATVVARDLTKSFGPHLVLDRVTCTISPGSRIGVVAPNGTGKTTLLRLLAGLDRPDAGVVERQPQRATVGLLAQEPERRPAETLAAFLARRTGVRAAEVELDLASVALADGEHGAGDRYADALDTYLGLGGPDFDARVGEVLAEVGLDATRSGVAMTDLSGGQAARAALAALLLSRYDVFLLDEPTNDLDFSGIDRLERFVHGLGAGCVIVSHDRAFLDRTVTTVLELDEHAHTAKEFRGGWAAYLDERAVERRHAEEHYDTYVARRDELRGRAQRESEWAHQGVNKAKKSGETDKYIRHFNRASSERVAAKAKQTERMMDRLDPVEKPWEGWELRLEFSEAPRAGAVVARLAAAVVTRGDFVLGPIDLEIGHGERVALVGVNGSGKSTLLGALLGELELESGDRHLGPGVVVGTLDQRRARFVGDDGLLDAFVGDTGLAQTEARSLLAKFGLVAEHVARSVGSLSSGERTRAELARFVARGVNCLVLDEPTNHLDVTAIEQVEQALESFSGTIILVTHDRALLDAVPLTRRVELAAGRVVHDGGV
jgi:ATPase subunit of ABC transporter with duplicated ATPase domains